MADENAIVFFDGVCGLCNSAVDRLLRWDRRGVLKFAPLQGETARQLLADQDIENLSSMVFVRNGRAYRRTAAAVRILWQLGGWQRLLGTLLWLVPLPLRDLAYRLIAGSRYRLFGKKESCRLPTPEERARFLD